MCTRKYWEGELGVQDINKCGMCSLMLNSNYTEKDFSISKRRGQKKLEDY
jgi:hypothetical protein